jgi:hypothetical protein
MASVCGTLAEAAMHDGACGQDFEAELRAEKKKAQGGSVGLEVSSTASLAWLPRNNGEILTRRPPPVSGRLLKCRRTMVPVAVVAAYH